MALLYVMTDAPEASRLELSPPLFFWVPNRLLFPLAFLTSFLREIESFYAMAEAYCVTHLTI